MRILIAALAATLIAWTPEVVCRRPELIGTTVCSGPICTPCTVTTPTEGRRYHSDPTGDYLIEDQPVVAHQSIAAELIGARRRVSLLMASESMPVMTATGSVLVLGNQLAIALRPADVATAAGVSVDELTAAPWSVVLEQGSFERGFWTCSGRDGSCVTDQAEAPVVSRYLQLRLGVWMLPVLSQAPCGVGQETFRLLPIRISVASLAENRSVATYRRHTVYVGPVVSAEPLSCADEAERTRRRAVRQ